VASSHLRLTGSYSWIASRVVFAAPDTVLTGTFYGGARHQGQLHFYIDLKPGLQLNASLYGVGSSHSGAIPAYTRFDAAAVWQASERLGLQLGIQNALDPRHREFLPRSGPQAEIERAVYAQLTVR
jgi:outer membrane receptor protein involved in Fe transport